MPKAVEFTTDGGGRWAQPGEDPHTVMVEVLGLMELMLATICRNDGRLLAGAFISLCAERWAAVSDEKFEKAVAEILVGFHKQRAYIQSCKAEKSS